MTFANDTDKSQFFSVLVEEQICCQAICLEALPDITKLRQNAAFELAGKIL